MGCWKCLVKFSGGDVIGKFGILEMMVICGVLVMVKRGRTVSGGEGL